jgi:hypothetical protein
MTDGSSPAAEAMTVHDSSVDNILQECQTAYNEWILAHLFNESF